MWEGVKNTVIQAIGDIIAKELVYMTFGKAMAAMEAKREAAKRAESTLTTQTKTLNMLQETAVQAKTTLVKLGLSQAETSADATKAGAKLLASLAPKGLIGIGLAAAGIAAMLVMLKSIKQTAFARGGLVTQPTLALIGETGKREFVTPEIDFFNWSERLANNIMRRQDEANSYRDYSANITRAADEGGMRDATIINNYNIKDRRELASVISGLVDHHKARV